MRLCWLLRGAVFLPGALSTIFGTPLGTHLPVNELTEVQVSSDIPTFDLTKPCGLEAPDSTTSACIISSSKLVSCPLTLTSVGDDIYKLYETDAGTKHYLDALVMRAYPVPVVSAMTPTSLPLSGGTKLEITFTSALGSPDFPRFSNLKARFVHRTTGVYKDASVSFEEDAFLKVVGRSPSFLDSSAVSAGDVVDLQVALNGRSFVATGLSATMIDKPKVKVGFMYVGSPDDFGWTFQHNLARLELEKKFFGQIQTITQNYVLEWGPNVCDFCHEEPGWNHSKNMGMWNDEPDDFFGMHSSAMVIKKWVEEEDVKIIVAASFYYQWDVYHMANRYPHVAFVHVGGWLTRPNLAQIFPKVYQARYLSGIAMGWYIKKHNLPKQIGYLSSFPLGETARAINALKLGLDMVDPDIDIYLTWMQSWHDDRKEELATRRLIKYYGVEGIAQHTDSRSPQLAARDLGKMGTGYNTDMLLTVGDTVLTSPILQWGGEYALIVQHVLDGDVNVETTAWNGFDKGAVRLSDLSPLVPAEAKLQIAEEEAKLQRGEDTIFCKPNMYDNRGRLRNGPTNPAVRPVPWEIGHLQPGTTCLSGPVVNQVCQEYDGLTCVDHWLLAGVHDTCASSPRMPTGIQAPLLPTGTCFLGVMDLPDKCAAGEKLEVIGCVKAKAGHYARDEKEYPCESGYYSPTEGAEACLPCPSGKTSAGTGSFQCTGCQPGYYSNTAALSECAPCGPGLYTDKNNATQCDFCPVSTYSSSEGMAKCTSCPAAMTTENIASSNQSACVCSVGTYRQGSASNCISCPASSSTDAIDSKSESDCLCDKFTYMPLGGGVCLPCPDTMTCARGSSEATYGPHLGTKSGDVTKEYPRLKPRFWASADKPMFVFECDSVDVCPGGDPGPAACAGGLEGQSCEHCPEDHIWDGKECGPCMDVEASALLFPLVPLIVAPILISIFYWMFGDEYEKWGTWRNGVSSLVFIILNNYQIVALMGDLNIVHGKSHESFFSFWSFSSDATTIFRPECARAAGFQSGMVVKTLAPAVLIVLFMLTWGVSQALAKVVDKQQLAMEKNRLMNVYLSLIMTFFAGISAMAFTLFKCTPNPNGLKTLLADRAVNCYEDEWNGMIGLGVVAILVWCIGFGVLFAWAIWKSPVHFPNPDFQMRWKFLFIKYRPDVHWWSMVFVFKGILLNLGFLVMQTGVGQIYWVMTILMVYLLMAINWTPWRHLWVNGLDIWAHMCLILTVSTMIWFASSSLGPQERADLDTDVANLTIACTFFLLPTVFPILGWMIYSQTSPAAQQAKARLALDVRKVCLHIAELTEDNFIDFVLKLSDRDYYYVEQSKHVLAQELLQVKSRTGYSLKEITSHEVPDAPTPSWKSAGGSEAFTSESTGIGGNMALVWL